MNGESFAKICLEKFRFLTESFGYRDPVVEQDPHYCAVSYTGALTVVTITFERLDQYIFVDLDRLRDGKLADDYMERRQNSIDLQTLLDIRAPERKPFPPGLTGRVLPAAEVETIVTDYVDALRQFAADVLQGDFRILPEVQALTRSRT